MQYSSASARSPSLHWQSGCSGMTRTTRTEKNHPPTRIRKFVRQTTHTHKVSSRTRDLTMLRSVLFVTLIAMTLYVSECLLFVISCLRLSHQNCVAVPVVSLDSGLHRSNCSEPLTSADPIVLPCLPFHLRSSAPPAPRPPFRRRLEAVVPARARARRRRRRRRPSTRTRAARAATRRRSTRSAAAAATAATCRCARWARSPSSTPRRAAAPARRAMRPRLRRCVVRVLVRVSVLSV